MKSEYYMEFRLINEEENNDITPEKLIYRISADFGIESLLDHFKNFLLASSFSPHVVSRIKYSDEEAS